MRPPGPAPVSYRPWSLLAHARRMGRDPSKLIGERFVRYGDLYQATFLGRRVFATRDPALISQILIRDAESFGKPRVGIVASQLRRLLGRGLLLSDGELWRRQRRLIQPAFKRERLQQYGKVIAAFAEDFARRLHDGAALDVSASMMQLTLRIVAKTLFDQESGPNLKRVTGAVEVLRSGFGGLNALLPRWLPTRRNRQLRSALADLDGLIYELLEEGSTDESNLLAALAQVADDSGGMDRQQIRDELMTMLLAGHETTSHALSWTFHLLARHPDVERRVREEVHAICGARAPAYDDVDKLVYTEQVLSEAMRLYPPAYAIPRVCLRDTTLGGYPMAAGTDAMIWVYHVHHDARWFPDPERFDPERFSPARKGEIPDGAYLPFGLGTRTCIGKHFALMEAKLILACTLRQLRFVDHALAPIERDMAVTLAPRGGLPMRVQRLA